MIDLRFQRVELEYARLKEEFAAGRITADELERALEKQTIEAGGRFWALGANSGKWYMSDGDTWTEAEPPSVAEPARVPVPAPVAPVPPYPQPQQRSAAPGPPPAGAPAAPASSFGKRLRPHQWVLGCGIGCLAPLLIVGGLAQIFWSLTEGSHNAVWFGTTALCLGVFTASVCAVALLPRIPFVVFLGAAILWTIIGFLMRMTGFGSSFFGWFSGLALWFSGMAAVVGVLAGFGVRKLVTR